MRSLARCCWAEAVALAGTSLAVAVVDMTGASHERTSLRYIISDPSAHERFTQTPKNRSWCYTHPESTSCRPKERGLRPNKPTERAHKK